MHILQLKQAQKVNINIRSTDHILMFTALPLPLFTTALSLCCQPYYPYITTPLLDLENCRPWHEILLKKCQQLNGFSISYVRLCTTHNLNDSNKKFFFFKKLLT